MFMTPTDPIEIKQLICSLKESAAGWDLLTSRIITAAANELVVPLVHILNLSLETGEIPIQLFFLYTFIASKLGEFIKLFKHISNWLCANKLSLNVSKSKYMIFNKQSKNHPGPKHVKISNTDLEGIREVKFLGIVIDNKLSWAPHLKYITSKAAKEVGILSKLRKSFGSQTMKTVNNETMNIIHSFIPS